MKDNTNNEKFSYELLVKYLANEAGNDEKIQVENWINENAENQTEFTNNKELLKKVDLYYQTVQFDNNAAWINVRSRMNQQPQFAEVQGKKQIRIASLLKYAAVLIFMVVAGTMVYYLAFRNKPNALIEIHATNQVLQEQTLPDGTRVTLNSHSMMHFPKVFNGKTREVSIEGEAFFEVKSDSNHPFVITAGDAKIRVLGTSFNVNAYPDKELVEVIVKTGKVSFGWYPEDTAAANSLILTPGEKGTLSYQEKQLIKTTNTDPNYLAWKTRNLIFRETSLEEVFKNLKKIYQVDIQTKETEINALTITVEFDDQPIDNVLEIIQETFNLQLDHENGQYIFSHANKQ